MAKINRRLFLSASVAGASFATLFGLPGLMRKGRAQEDITTIINTAATAEAFAVTHYFRALQDTAKFDRDQIDYLRSSLESEQIHLDFLVAAGATPLATEFYFPQGTFDTTDTFATITATAETVFVAAYTAATYQFSLLGQPALAATAAQIAVVEGQHLALVRQLGNLHPNDIAYGEPLFTQVSEAAGILAPLLDGNEGALGAMETTAVPFPELDAIRTTIGPRLLKRGVLPFTEFLAGSQPVPTDAATSEATQEGTLAAPSNAAPTAVS